ncbi:hypothetical protein L6164_031581 [Bauhinia variegata]|uniref:Uncharacterized protein n=1 Tax=Bauhinia variegata TaxID=167791 RepID=A0ACB9LHH0_BAUVA|nr:hypothetical protein L6164_031581 [Bauhinia variegata]
MKDNHQKESHKLDEVVSELHQDNLAPSLAEKDMSVSNLVPTVEDGEVDQDRMEHGLLRCNIFTGVFRSANFNNLLLEQTGCNVGRFKIKRWFVEVSWKDCFAIGWYTWCNEFDRQAYLILEYS